MPQLDDVLSGCEYDWVAAQDASLEAYVAARVLVEALRRAGPQPTPQATKAALERFDPLELGGLAVRYGPAPHAGLGFSELTMLRADGSFTRKETTPAARTAGAIRTASVAEQCVPDLHLGDLRRRCDHLVRRAAFAPAHRARGARAVQRPGLA